MNHNFIGMIFKKSPSLKRSITHFGLMGHEIAVLKSTMESTPALAADYELREPNHAGTCDIVVVNKDSQLATSWWKNYKKRHPVAIPLYLSDSKDTLDDRVYSKRPFSPSVLRAAVEDLISREYTTTAVS